jgi:hypothetical protein
MLSAEPWGGAAGSRGTVVTISLADGRYPCALSGSLTASVVDANGTLLVSGQTASAASVQLESNVAFTVGVAWSNWCADPPANPVSLSLKARGWSSAVDVSTPAGQESVPPCLGAGQPSSLSITDLQRAP